MNLSEKRKLFDDDIDIPYANPIITTTFFLKADLTVPLTLILTPKSVYYYHHDNKQSKKGFIITFDTIYHILRPKYKPEEKIFGIPNGIKFISPLYESMEFYGDNPK